MTREELIRKNMLKIYTKPHVVVVQDASPKDLCPANDFIDFINGVVDLTFENGVRKLPELFRNKMMRICDNSDEYNAFIAERKLFRMQVFKLIRHLMEKHLPVTLPDHVYFQEEYRKIGEIQNAEIYDEKFKQLTLEYQKAIKISIEQNEKYGKKYGLYVPTYEDIKKEDEEEENNKEK